MSAQPACPHFAPVWRTRAKSKHCPKASKFLRSIFGFILHFCCIRADQSSLVISIAPECYWCFDFCFIFHDESRAWFFSHDCTEPVLELFSQIQRNASPQIAPV